MGNSNQNSIKLLLQGVLGGVAIALGTHSLLPQLAASQTPPGPTPGPTVVRNPITVLSDIQESNSNAGTIVARGNVFVDYPARNLEATSAQAQYFSNERRLILSGDVLVLQEGNSLRAEIVTYLVDEGRLIALPLPNRQVESIYLIPESTAQPGGAAPINEALLDGNPTGDPQPAAVPPVPTPVPDAVEVIETPPASTDATDAFDPEQGPFDF